MTKRFEIKTAYHGDPEGLILPPNLTPSWEGGDSDCDHRRENVFTPEPGQENNKGSKFYAVTLGDCRCAARRVDKPVP